MFCEIWTNEWQIRLKLPQVFIPQLITTVEKSRNLVPRSHRIPVSSDSTVHSYFTRHSTIEPTEFSSVYDNDSQDWLQNSSPLQVVPLAYRTKILIGVGLVNNSAEAEENPRRTVYRCEVHAGSEIQTAKRGEGENRSWMVVCKIIGWNEGDRTESACGRRPQMPDACPSFSRSRHRGYARPAWPGPHRKSLPRRQLSAASTSDWLESQYNRFAIPSGTIALSGLSAVAPLEIPVGGTWRSFGFSKSGSRENLIRACAKWMTFLECQSSPSRENEKPSQRRLTSSRGEGLGNKLGELVNGCFKWADVSASQRDRGGGILQSRVTSEFESHATNYRREPAGPR